tara:strand:+ start:339 stop:503 length:165 start_codon:yes stop_codon:yes gene_type:complete
MEQDPEVPDKLWATVMENVYKIETACKGNMDILNFKCLKQAVGMIGCLQYKFEA